ncbi:thiamine-binding protein [Georgenia sp. MJ170]|uniref:thiamine-binding protein n=1 Tax=Georgenia sunbinii TaxID=3117728 RepID=UPI002F26B557
MLFAFSVAPTTSDAPDGSVSRAVADAVRVVRDSGLSYETTSMFTTVEGEWDEVMPVIKAACDAVAATSPRVSLVLKADLRPGWQHQLEAKAARVAEHLDVPPGSRRGE